MAAGAGGKFYLKAQTIQELQRANQQNKALDTARKLYREYCLCCGSGVGHQDRTAATQAIWDKVGRVRLRYGSVVCLCVCVCV